MCFIWIAYNLLISLFYQIKNNQKMSLVKLISAQDFINRLTVYQFTPMQQRRAVAYLRAKKVVFYDDWSRDHVMILDHSQQNKVTVIEALKAAYN